MIEPRSFLRTLFDAAVASAAPALCVPPHLPLPPKGRTIVIGAGKAAASMAKAVEENWSGPLSGLVVTRYGHAVATDRIAVVEASHPIQDEAGAEAATRILRMVQGLTADDLVLALISGGGSSLLPLPPPGVTLADKRALNAALLTCGASISEINIVRKHVSAIKGGRLAAACWPARVVSLIISDVPGDDPATIASGPTLGDPTTRADALAVLGKYRIAGPPAILAHLNDPACESIKPDDPRLAGGEIAIVASAQGALAAAADIARTAFVTPVILGDSIEGEARVVAAEHAELAREALRNANLPLVLISGGETSVTVRGHGRGGRNAEYALALAVALEGQAREGQARIHAIACDTDGIDGTESNAGALIGPDTLARARAIGLDAQARLDDNDAYGLFQALGDLVECGPTLTNVNDFRAILVLPDSE